MRTTFIYVLKEPTTGVIRYVGKTDNPVKRLRTHLASKTRCHRSCWVQSLLAKGLKPVLEVVDEVLFSEWESWEAAYIQFYLDEGFDLTNGTFGGDAPLMTPEVCRKISESKVGEKNPMFGKLPWCAGKTFKNPKKREQMLASGGPMKGKVGELHPRFGKVPWNKGLKATPEQIERQRESHIGKKLSLESIQKRYETRKQNGWNRRDR